MSLSLSLSLFVFVSVSVSFLPLPLPLPPSLFLPPSFPLSLSLSLSSLLLLLLLLLACDTWLDTVAQGRTNPPPDKIPWSTFRTISPYMEDVLITILIRYVTPTHLIAVLDSTVHEMKGLTRDQVLSMHHLTKQLRTFENLPYHVSVNDVSEMIVLIGNNKKST